MGEIIRAFFGEFQAFFIKLKDNTRELILKSQSNDRNLKK